MAKLRFTTLRHDYPEEITDEWGEVEREWGNFKAKVHDTLEKIAYELRRLDVAEGIIELDISDSDIRRFRGEYPSVSEPFSPRVRLTFSHPKVGPLQYPCGNYYSQKDNLRAIVLTLESQRAIERYGATIGGQQYEGWKGLPPGEEQEQYFVDEGEAADFISELAGIKNSKSLISDQEYLAYCYKKAAKAAHPDTGGTEKRFKTLQQAKSILDNYFAEDEAEVA